ncbi:MAG: metallophosphoesterase family protein [Vicinamibacterales bacterium]
MNDRLIGLVSDTHGQFRDGIRAALDGVSLILHAGDVGGSTILRELRDLAPVQAVYGNVDDRHDPGLAGRIELTVHGVTIHASHGHELGSPTPRGMLDAYPADIVIFGHTHRAVIERVGGRLAVNPGAAGPRRFNLKPSVARLTLAETGPVAEIIWL